MSRQIINPYGVTSKSKLKTREVIGDLHVDSKDVKSKKKTTDDNKQRAEIL